jgi:hypothetical protein
MRGLRFGVVLALACGPALAAGCGGAIAPGGAEGDDGGRDAMSVRDGPPAGDSPSPTATVDSGPPTEDAPITPIDAPSVDSPADVPIVPPDGPCLVNLEPCIVSSQCCFGQCMSGICGGTPPVCLPDGTSCSSDALCCSGVCGGGVCGAVVVDAGPPACVPPAPTPCMSCVAGSCCPQLAACEGDPVCSASIQCFDACYVPGQGAACSQKCTAQFPGALTTAITQCGAMACGGPCQ